jgi:1-phosphatidylinositol-4-phosphate 5-kinase
VDQDFHNTDTFSISHPALTDYKKCVFTEFCPKVFFEIRRLDGIGEDYLDSLGPDGLSKLLTGQVASFRGQGSTGKSGSFFFNTHDGKYLVKTIKSSEKDFLQKNVGNVYQYFKTEGPRTLIAKIMSFFEIELTSLDGTETLRHYLIVMKNIFSNPGIKNNFEYDLKGALHQRMAT